MSIEFVPDTSWLEEITFRLQSPFTDMLVQFVSNCDVLDAADLLQEQGARGEKAFLHHLLKKSVNGESLRMNEATRHYLELRKSPVAHSLTPWAAICRLVGLDDTSAITHVLHNPTVVPCGRD